MNCSNNEIFWMGRRFGVARRSVLAKMGWLLCFGVRWLDSAFARFETMVRVACTQSGVKPPQSKCSRRMFGAATVCIGVPVLLAVILNLSAPCCAVAEEPADNAVVKVAFNADCEKLLIQQIDRAEKDVIVAIYNITRRNITGALVRAVQRGVNVRLKYEAKSHSDSEKMTDTIDFLEGKGIVCTSIKMADKEGIMHDKFTVIDRKRVLTGSFNYTSSASTVNYENLVLIESAAVAKRYIEEFEKIKSKQ
jgi:hypothetical protein